MNSIFRTKVTITAELDDLQNLFRGQNQLFKFISDYQMSLFVVFYLNDF
jgi:hypothetical protein